MVEESSNDTDPPSSKKSNGVGEKAVTSSELQDDIASLVSEARALIKYVARQREFLGNITDGVAAYDKLTNAIAVAVKTPTDASWNRLKEAHRAVLALVHRNLGLRERF